jgi:hypothetical protein
MPGASFNSASAAEYGLRGVARAAEIAREDAAARTVEEQKLIAGLGRQPTPVGRGGCGFDRPQAPPALTLARPRGKQSRSSTLQDFGPALRRRRGAEKSRRSEIAGDARSDRADTPSPHFTKMTKTDGRTRVSRRAKARWRGPMRSSWTTR